MIGFAACQSHRAVEVVIGADTHKDQHVAVAIDGRGVRLGERHVRATTCASSTTMSGYEDLERWSSSFGSDPSFRN